MIIAGLRAEGVFKVNKPVLKYEDEWGREVYELNDTLYVSVDGELHTIEKSAGFEEPGYPIGVKCGT